MHSTKLFYRFVKLKNLESFRFFSSEYSVSVQFENGLPQFKIPLPSRAEYCLFIMSPLSQSVGDLINYIEGEDKGVDRVAFYDKNGVRVAKSNSIYSLLCQDFSLHINDKSYSISKPLDSAMGDDQLEESIQRLGDVKNLINQLNITLKSEDFNLQTERKLKSQEQELLKKLEPLEKQRNVLASKSARYTRRVTWLGLGAMGLQFGLLARLTWWEYSWDIMEPVTYFVGYGTAIGMYAYYVVTRQEYCFPQVFDREYLKRFYQLADKDKFDIEQYNNLKESLSQIQIDLKRLRDPLKLNLPLQQHSIIDQPSETSPSTLDPQHDRESHLDSTSKHRH